MIEEVVCTEVFCNPLVVRKLFSIVGRDRVNRGLKRRQQGDDRVCNRCRFFSLNMGNQRITRAAFVQGNKGLFMTRPDHQVGLLVTISFSRSDNGLPVLTTNCSNNYGPYHFPEKLIPLMIVNALAGKPLHVYGDGLQVRDWLYVKDHCSAISRVLETGRPGETYNVGGWNEKPNIEIVHTVCALLYELRPKADGSSYAAQITHVQDRPGHDRRYAIDARKIERELGWKPAETFETGIRKTVQWYLNNPEWVANVQSGAYREWVSKQYEGAAA